MIFFMHKEVVEWLEDSSPREAFKKGLHTGWAVLRTIYWNNTIPWRIVKSLALFFFGFFNLAMANLLLSYKPSWTFLYFFMAYGFLVIVYGPFHHLLVIPLSLRFNKKDWGQSINVGKNGPFIMILVFFTLVGVMGFLRPDVMKFKFSAMLGSGRVTAVDPRLRCLPVENKQYIHCRMTKIHGNYQVTVENNGRTLLRVKKEPYEFTINPETLKEVVGQKQFQIVLRDKNGNMIRRFVKTVSMVRL